MQTFTILSVRAYLTPATCSKTTKLYHRNYSEWAKQILPQLQWLKKKIVEQCLIIISIPRNKLSMGHVSLLSVSNGEEINIWQPRLCYVAQQRLITDLNGEERVEGNWAGYYFFYGLKKNKSFSLWFNWISFMYIIYFLIM